MMLVAVADDPDAAQARIFLDQLDAEIDIIAARIETVESLTERARRAHRLTDRLRAEAAALHAELYEVHRLVAAIVLRFPEVMTHDASAGRGARHPDSASVSARARAHLPRFTYHARSAER